MTLTQINRAAKALRAAEPSLTWQDALSWASQCWREAQVKADAERQAFFEARREALRAKRWLGRVRTAKQRPYGSWSATWRTGGRFAGDCVQFQPPPKRVA